MFFSKNTRANTPTWNRTSHTGNYEVMSELAECWRKAITGKLRGKRAAVTTEASKAGKSIREAHRNNYKTKMIAFRNLYGTVTVSRKVMEKMENQQDRIIVQNGNLHIGNYAPISLLCVVYELFTCVILNRIDRVLNEEYLCEQAELRREFITVKQLHRITRLTGASQLYTKALRRTSTDLKKIFDSVETKRVIEAFITQEIPTQYIKTPRKVYEDFTTKIFGLFIRFGTTTITQFPSFAGPGSMMVFS